MFVMLYTFLHNFKLPEKDITQREHEVNKNLKKEGDNIKMIYLGHSLLTFFILNLKDWQFRKKNVYKITIRVEPITDNNVFILI